MSTSSYDNSRWLDEALKDVSVPPELLARLRRLGIDSDDQLDETLQAVAVPSVVVARLKQIPADVRLDKAIANVDVPAGLAASLKQILDGVQDVPITETSAVAASTSADSSRRLSARSMVLAASLLIAATVALILVFRPQDGNGPREFVDVEVLVPDTSADNLLATSTTTDATSLATDSFTQPRSPESVEQGAIETPSELLARNRTVFDPARQINDPLFDPSLYIQPQLGMPDQDAAPLRVDAARMPSQSRFSPPLVKGFDLQELLARRSNPFVDPGEHRLLASIQVPLQLHSHRELDGALVTPETHLENVLAAVDLGLPMPQDQALSLHVYGGPSPWAPLERQMLMVAVQARNQPTAVRPPVDVTLVIDAAAYTPGVDGLDNLRRALRAWIPTLEPHDRVTLILAGNQPYPLIVDAPPTQQSQLLRAIDYIAARPVGNLSTSLELALARPSDPARTQQVTVVTSDLTHLATSQKDRLLEKTRQAAMRGVQLNVVRIGDDDNVDDFARKLSAAGAGSAGQGATAKQLRAVLHRMITGQSPTVARRVRLLLNFNSESVERYRLLGHAADVTDIGFSSAPVEVELDLGESAHAMIEFELSPRAEIAIGDAELSWRDARTNEDRLVRRSIKWPQFASTLAEAALPLQRATAVAAAAEFVLRSHHVPADVDRDDIVELADSVDVALFDEPWRQQLLRILQSPPRS